MGIQIRLHLLSFLAALIIMSGCTTPQNEVADAGGQPLQLGGNSDNDDNWDDFEDDWDDFDDDLSASSYWDPFEGVNRAIFTFNDGVYGYVLRPIAKGYTAVVPNVVSDGISNFFYNLKYPVRAVNQVLQGKFEASLKETGMFLVNTTYGLAGFIDRSEAFPGLVVPPEDFGQTLGFWGFGNGPYLVLPILGPSSVRDGVGRAGDYFLYPPNYLGYWQWEADWSASGVETINSVPGIIDIYDAVTSSALDKYSAVKDGYLQRREKMVEE